MRSLRVVHTAAREVVKPFAGLHARIVNDKGRYDSPNLNECFGLYQQGDDMKSRLLFTTVLLGSLTASLIPDQLNAQEENPKHILYTVIDLARWADV